MVPLYLIIEVLKRHSSEKKQHDTHLLNQKEILHFLQKDYPYLSDEITAKTVRWALQVIREKEEMFPDQYKALRFRKKNGRITGYWTANSISDPELKFLIDSVMYGNIINTRNAQNLAKRIQGLSGKNLYNLTPYASGAFGKQKYLPNIDVLENVNQIMQAQMKQRKVRFQLNVFTAKYGKIELSPTKDHSVSPLEMLLHGGRYYLMAAYDNTDKLYFFRVDLITEIRRLDDRARKRDEFAVLKGFERDRFMLKHPIMYGGQEKRFKLKIKKEYFTQVVDTFSDSIQILPGSDTGDAVEVAVYASDEAMRRWLLQYGDIAEALDMDDVFAHKMRVSIDILRKNMSKFCGAPFGGRSVCAIIGTKNGGIQMKQATIEEMREEALLRLKLLRLPKKLLQQLSNNFTLKVTYFSGDVGGIEEIHKKALRMFRETYDHRAFPFYITESWHGMDVISILYVGADKDAWEHERKMAEMGYHAIFGYNLECTDLVNWVTVFLASRTDCCGEWGDENGGRRRYYQFIQSDLDRRRRPCPKGAIRLPGARFYE